MCLPCLSSSPSNSTAREERSSSSSPGPLLARVVTARQVLLGHCAVYIICMRHVCMRVSDRGYQQHVCMCVPRNKSHMYHTYIYILELILIVMVMQ